MPLDLFKNTQISEFLGRNKKISPNQMPHVLSYLLKKTHIRFSKCLLFHEIKGMWHYRLPHPRKKRESPKGPGSSAGNSASENEGKAQFPPLGGGTSLYLKRTVARLCWLMLLSGGKMSSTQSSVKYLTVMTNIPKRLRASFSS